MSLTIPQMSNIKMVDLERMCGRWILHHKPLLCQAPGTTFPPASQNLHYFKPRLQDSINERSKGKFLSEPDLSPEFQDIGVYGDLNHQDEDFFEFDFGSPGSDVDSSIIRSEFDESKIINATEGDILKNAGRRISVSSDSSSSCSHRKDSGSSAVHHGFSSIFGPTASGVESGRRSSSLQSYEYEEDERLEGLSVDPSGWKDSCAIYLNTKFLLNDTTDGYDTPTIVTTGPQVDSPIVSPDSLLDEDSLLEDHNLCIECATYHYNTEPFCPDGWNTTIQAVSSKEDTLFPLDENHSNENASEFISDKQETCDRSSILIENDEICEKSEKESKSDVTAINDNTFEPLINVLSPPHEPETVEINPNLYVSMEKLNSLLGQLESDRLYPNQDIDNSKESEDKFGSLTPVDFSGLVQEKPKLRKSSSLRSGRTPPATPGGRKMVRFADILGLDLSEIKVFSDEIPRVPKEAYEDLDVNPSDFEVGSPISTSIRTFLPTSPKVSPSTSLVPMFNQPGVAPNFMETVIEKKVCLENAAMESPSVVSGVVRVLNMSFNKSVTVRWTVDDWATHKETDCEYVQGSSSKNMDKFSFKLVTDTLAVGSRMQLCLKYECAGEHWDSNGGVNYVFQVFLNSNSNKKNLITKTQPIAADRVSRSYHLPQQSPSQHGDDPWLRFI